MASPLISFPSAGCLVEFMQGNQPQLGYVLEEQSGKIRVWTMSKRETKMPSSRLLPWSGPVHAGQDKAAIDCVLAEHAARRAEIAQHIDPLEIWEMTRLELSVAPAQWFAELFWQEPDADHIAAMGRVLLNCKTHFKFQPPEFVILDEETVEKRIREAQEAQAREKLASLGRDFLKTLWNVQNGDKAPAFPDEAENENVREELAQLLRTRIANPDDSATEALWKDMKKGLPDHPHLALVLAQKWGIVPVHHNFHLDQAGYEWGDDWSSAFADEIARQQALVDGLGEPDPTPFISVDAPTTRDIDDAFHLEHDENGYRLSLAFACPPFGWEFDNDLDMAVRDRATSIYLPEGAANMMPRAMGVGMYSLFAGQIRPALVLDATFDAQGVLQSSDLRVAAVDLAENSTYEAAENGILNEDSTYYNAWKLADLLRNQRIANGAIVIDRPDPAVELCGDGAGTSVRVFMKQSTPHSQLMVSEFMVFANELMAIWAQERGIALYHRTQDMALPMHFAGVWSDPCDIHRVVKQFGPSLLEVQPKPHRGLGLKLYAPSTSPLRRYPDLVNSAQIFSFLKTGEAKWTAEELEERLPRISNRLDAAGQVQRFRPRYWKLLYIRQNLNMYHDAVAVEECGQLISFAIPELQIFARAPKKLAGEKFLPGQQFMIRFSKADPLTNELRIVEVLEA